MAARVQVKEWLQQENLTRLEGWAKSGLSVDQIASNIGITRKTLYNWREKHLPILHALRVGREAADFEVENALFKRATGYSYEEETWETVTIPREEHDEILEVELAVWDEENPNASKNKRDAFILSIPRSKPLLTKVIKKQTPPDTKAIEFFLSNRKPDVWKKQQKIEHSGEMTVHNDNMQNLSEQELKNLANLDA